MPQEKYKILLVEDDKALGKVTTDYLTFSGYEVRLCEDGKAGLDAFRKEKFDLCILDIMLPKMDGFALAEKIRIVNDHTPIIFLTSKSGKEDKIQGFKTGGDDYIVKPFDVEELVLRMEVFLKRTATISTEKSFSIGNTVFDYQNYFLNCNGTKRKLTHKEAETLSVLCQNLNQVVKRDDLLKKVWGSDDYFLGRSLDVFISKLRKYLEADNTVSIENHHGVGFKMTAKN